MQPTTHSFYWKPGLWTRIFKKTPVKCAISYSPKNVCILLFSCFLHNILFYSSLSPIYLTLRLLFLFTGPSLYIIHLPSPHLHEAIFTTWHILSDFFYFLSCSNWQSTRWYVAGLWLTWDALIYPVRRSTAAVTRSLLSLFLGLLLTKSQVKPEAGSQPIDK